MIKLNKKEIADIVNGELSDSLYERTYDYLSANNEMPYGIQKARTGDPYEFVLTYLTNEIKGL